MSYLHGMTVPVEHVPLHFNAVDQVPGGFLGALIIEDPKDPGVALDQTLILNDGPSASPSMGKASLRRPQSRLRRVT
jgi:hypothetical protein